MRPQLLIASLHCYDESLQQRCNVVHQLALCTSLQLHSAACTTLSAHCALRHLVWPVGMLRASLPSLHSELVTGQASSQRYPSDFINGVACPLQWLPVVLAGTHPPASRRRLARRVFTSKGSLRRAVQAFNAINTTDASAAYGPIAN